MNTFLQVCLTVSLIVSICQAQNGVWDTTKNPMPTIRWSAAAGVVDDKIYVIGGFIQPSETESWASYGISKIEVYDPATDSWDTTRSSMPTPRGHMASAVVNDKIYIIGGTAGGADEENYWQGLDCIESYDLNTDSWDTTLTPMPTARFECQAAVVDDKIYVFGGLSDYPDLKAINTLEVYDPETDRWDTAKTQMPTAKAYPVASAIGSSIYITGGYPGVPLIDYPTVELYDTITDRWNTTIADMPGARAAHTAGILNGFIYIIGGSHRISSTHFIMQESVLMYDPLMDTWLKVAEMPTAREALTLRIVNGRFYAIGGGFRDYSKTWEYWKNVNIVEVYIPVQYPIYAYNFDSDRNFCNLESDSLHITSEFINHFDHGFSAQCYYTNFDKTYKDSVLLYDDGLHGDSLNNDGIYGNYIKNVMVEDNYNLEFVTTNIANGEKFITIDAGKFTTIGPISWSENEYQLQHMIDSLYTLKLCLINESTVHTVTNLSAKLTSNDPNVGEILSGTNPQIFPDVEPSQSVECNGAYALYIRNNPGTIQFKLEIASEGEYWWTDSLQIVTTIHTDDIALPTEFKLHQNYPNPFNPITMINYQLPMINDVELSVYNLVGQKMVTLVSERQPAGRYSVEWDASEFSSGVYYYKIKTGEFQDVKKMVLLR